MNQNQLEKNLRIPTAPKVQEKPKVKKENQEHKPGTKAVDFYK